MAARATVAVLACLAVLTTGELAQAGGRLASSYYCAPVVVYYPVAARAPVFWVCPITPTVLPLAPRSRPANPVPAPPSQPGQTKEPPLESRALKAPMVLESRSPAAPKDGPLTEKCKVGFWNLTGRDITLKIDGQTRMLARDQAITVELSRAFVWQIDQREPASERVPAEESSHELIIRK